MYLLNTWLKPQNRSSWGLVALIDLLGIIHPIFVVESAISVQVSAGVHAFRSGIIPFGII